MNRRPPRSTHFPYTTLFRSRDSPAWTLLRRMWLEGGALRRGTRRFIELPFSSPDVGDILATWPIEARVSSDQWKRALSSDRKSTRLNSSHSQISYAVFCLEK